MLQVRLLGQFDIRAAGRRVSLSSRAAQSLLAYLVLTAGTAQRRERLAGLLWPDTADDRARHNLRTELWRVRKALGSPPPDTPDYFLAEELTIAFNPQADYWLDAAQLQQPLPPHTALDDLAAQLMLYEGDLLPGFYDDWVLLEREHVRAVFEQKIKGLLEGLCREQRWPDVIAHSERWLTLGQTPEPAYYALMLAYASLGERAKAVETFDRCQAALAHDLGVEPSAQTRAVYEQLLQVGDTCRIDWSVRPVALAHPPRVAESPAPGRPPFKGLLYFDTADADLFFGREALTLQFVKRLRDTNCLIIVGASGCGKSSIVRAGLIPALNCGPLPPDGSRPSNGQPSWHIHLITPTAHPLQALASEVTRGVESVTAAATLWDDLACDPRSLSLYLQRTRGLRTAPHAVEAHSLIVVDQFEELFTLCRDEFEREAFIDNLTTALALSREAGDGRFNLVLAIRADFYAHLAQYADLREAAEQQIYLGPMTPDELRRAIEAPAQRAGWTFEAGLVDLILRDVGDEPGALPLLSHALLETWQRRSGRWLTLKGYAEAGGIRSAIARTAEKVYQQLTPAQQSCARDVFVRLTEFGEGTEDTRRRVRLDELIGSPAQADRVRAVLALLADARLVTTNAETIEVAHEALIREWPQLREWLNEDREGLRLQRHLTEAAHEWESLDRDSGGLYRGARLAQASEWAVAHPIGLNAPERAFLAASQELAQREAAERAAQHQRELAAALQLAQTQQQAAARLRRRNRWLAMAGGLALLLAVLAGLFGLQAERNAAQADQNAAQAQINLSSAQASAATAQAEAVMRANAQAQAEDQSRLSLARELAAASANVRDLDPELGILLARQSLSQTYPVDGTVLPETQRALHQALQASRVELALMYQPGRHMVTVAFSPDGQSVVTVGGNTAQTWHLPTGRQLLTLGDGDKVVDAAYSPDGRRIVVIGYFGKIITFDAQTGDRGLVWSMLGNPQRLAFAPDGQRFAVATGDGLLALYDASTGELQRAINAHSDTINTVSFAADGTQVATAGADGTVKTWLADTGELVLTLSEDHRPISIRAGTGIATVRGVRGMLGVAFSPDQRYLATSSTDGAVTVWDAQTGQPRWAVVGDSDGAMGVAFSPDGAWVASAGPRVVSVWEARTGERVFTLKGHTDWVNDLAFSAAGTQLVTASSDGTIRVWNVRPEGRPELFTITGRALAYHPSGDHLATAWQGLISLWDTVTGQVMLSLQAPDYAGEFGSLAFSPDGTRLAAGAANGAVYVWEESGQFLYALRDPREVESSAAVLKVAFSPDSRQLAVVKGQAEILMWDVRTGELADRLGRLSFSYSHESSTFHSLAYSQLSAALIATAGGGGTELRRVSTGELLPLSLPHPLTVLDVAFSPDAQRLASVGDDGVVKIWDTAKPDNPRVKLLLRMMGHTGAIQRVVFSPDGTRLATASADQTVRLWDAATGVEVLNQGGSAAFTDVAFSPDGRYLAAANADGTARIYLLSIDELVAVAGLRVTRALTPLECQLYLHVAQCPSAP